MATYRDELASSYVLALTGIKRGSNRDFFKTFPNLKPEFLENSLIVNSIIIVKKV